MRLFGLIGYPLSHSFSQKYFEKKFEREKLTDCWFKNFPITTIDELPKVLNENTELHGLAVTIPYKQPVLGYLNDIQNIPPELKACNCIKIKNGKLYGYNTDHIGFKKSIAPLLKNYHKKALVLGNGGATEAVVFALKKLNIRFNIVSRTLHDNSTLVYEQINDDVVKESLVIINTTPLGMYPNTKTCPDIPYSAVTDKHLLFDLIYNPSQTLFLQKGEEKGAVIKNGEEMLELQAEENWKIWNEE